MTYPNYFAMPENLVVLDGNKILSQQHLLVPPHLEIIIRNPSDANRLQMILSEEYPKDFHVDLLTQNHAGEMTASPLPLSKLTDAMLSGEATALRIPPLPDNRSFEYFQNVVAVLRAPDGCPWDRKQTHQSLRDDFLQEVYELLEALDRNDLPSVAEELGDVLLHVVIQAQIALENDEFNMGDVLSHISEKLIFRHEHVFAKAEKLTPDEVISRWELMKKKERAKEQKNQGLLDGISKAMPALSMAFSYQKRAARVGYDWESTEGVWQKLAEEIEEFKQADTPETQSAEMGDIFFTLVNLARWMKIDPETALRTANLRFHDRIQAIEERAKSEGKDLFSLSAEEKDRFWEDTKKG